MRELEIIHHRQIEGMSLFFDTVEYRTPHFHAEWELIWITDGRLSVRCGSREYAGVAGDLFLFCPGQVHEFQQMGQSSTFLCLQIAPHFFGAAAPGFGRTVTEEASLRECLSTGQEAEAKALLGQMAADYLQRPAHYELSCAGACGRLMYLLLSSVPCRVMSEAERASAQERNARLERFIRFVDENYMHKIRLSDFAAAEGCSTSYLSRFIRTAMNQTFQEYVSSVRFHSACKLIAGGSRKMLDVCQDSGYSDYRYFSAAFRAQCGMTPEEYARRAVPPEEPVRRSLHSLERFYTREESLALLKKLRPE